MLTCLSLVCTGTKSNASLQTSKQFSTSATSVSSKSRHPNVEVNAAEQPQAVLLLTVTQQMLLDQGKMLDTARLGAFAKALSCVALHSEPGAAIGSLSLVNRLLRSGDGVNSVAHSFG